MNLPGPTSTSAINAVEGTEITDFLKIKIQRWKHIFEMKPPRG